MGIWRLRGEFFQDIDDGLRLRAGIAAAFDVLDDGLPVKLDGYHHSLLEELDERDDQSRLRGHEKHELPGLLIDFFCDVFLRSDT